MNECTCKPDAEAHRDNHCKRIMPGKKEIKRKEKKYTGDNPPQGASGEVRHKIEIAGIIRIEP